MSSGGVKRQNVKVETQQTDGREQIPWSTGDAAFNTMLAPDVGLTFKKKPLPHQLRGNVRGREKARLLAVCVRVLARHSRFAAAVPCPSKGGRGDVGESRQGI